jgi:diguanylate cyclase (GGDEF)-like protein
MEPAGAKVLVVDDSDINRTVYAHQLRQIPGVEVVEAPNGAQALALARKQEFAMYVIDIVMQSMDGFELASLLREEHPGETVPILFVTAQSPDLALVTRGYRMGAVDILVGAPVSADILTQKARVFLRLYEKRVELRRMLDLVQRENVDLHSKLEEYIRQQEDLRKKATHDSLTKLPNRALFEDRLDAAVRRSQRAKHRFALAYVDLDGFKDVNDRHGHAAGDALIVATAERLLRAVRASDTVARLGGDEFAMLFEVLDSPAGAEYVGAKVLRSLLDPVRMYSDLEKTEVEVRVGASIGIALYPDHALSSGDLIMLADMTMYAIKRSGGGVRLYGGNIASPQPGRRPHLQVIVGEGHGNE